MSNELILELELLLKNIEHGSPASLFIREVRALKAAITFISSHDSVRDRALEECREAIWNENTRTHAREKLGMQRAMKLIDELKSAPFTRKDGTTSPEPQMYERHKGSIAAYHTDDTRGTVDRRKSAEGSITDFDCPRLRRFGPTRYGRRPGDRARWTAAPVVECLSCGDTKKMPYEPLNPSSKTYPCPYCMPQQSSATQPAQEAPILLADWVDWTFGTDPATRPGYAFGLRALAKRIDELRELDARQGEK